MVGRDASSRSDPRIVTAVLGWYDQHARDLPWRRPERTPWEVMVSEFMLQQTPVRRVLGPWQSWMDRWPIPRALAAAPAGEAVRAWGRLGYPRRALRLHRAATVITDQYEGRVPDDYDDLLGLPGVGPYTAAAIATFGYGHRHVVLDTNVRRVLTRVVAGSAQPSPTITAADKAIARAQLPAGRTRAASWAVAAMELGALVCTARTPRCAECPIRVRCAWWRAGCPAWDGPRRLGQAYAGTDRQCRGALLAVLRSAAGAVDTRGLEAAWPIGDQRERALASLLVDGLAVPAPDGRYALPGD